MTALQAALGLTIVLAAATSGCGPDVAAYCEDLEAACSEVGDDCREDGELLQDWAADNCEEQFNAYFNCLEGAGCDWETSCNEERATLSACVGEFPN